MSGEAPHVIRLRGPWVLEEGRRVKLPAVWQEALGEVTSASLWRSFNRPTNLERVADVFLHVDSPQAIDSIRLNGKVLDDGLNVLSMLELTNRLEVALSLRDENTAILDAWLEIIAP